MHRDPPPLTIVSPRVRHPKRTTIHAVYMYEGSGRVACLVAVAAVAIDSDGTKKNKPVRQKVTAAAGGKCDINEKDGATVRGGSSGSRQKRQ